MVSSVSCALHRLRRRCSRGLPFRHFLWRLTPICVTALPALLSSLGSHVARDGATNHNLPRLLVSVSPGCRFPTGLKSTPRPAPTCTLPPGRPPAFPSSTDKRECHGRTDIRQLPPPRHRRQATPL